MLDRQRRLFRYGGADMTPDDQGLTAAIDRANAIEAERDRLWQENQGWVKIAAEQKAEVEKLRDLLWRVCMSSEDGTLDIPDVRHGFEAEITELLGESVA